MKGQEDNMKLIPKRQWITGGNENIFALMFSWGASCVLPKEMEWAYKIRLLRIIPMPVALLKGCPKCR